MEQERVKRVVELMARMASGDASAAFTLYEEFGAVIRRVLRSHLADLGATQVPNADLDGLTLDAVIALLDAAPAWRPDGGAMPWTWAERRLRALASGYVGQWTQELGDEHDGAAAGGVPVEDRDDMEHLARAAVTDPTVQLLVEALALRCKPRDAKILVAVKAQAAAGDPSPSNTVAAEQGMKPAAVRQVVKRSRDSLRALADSDDRFAPLRDLALLAR